MSSEEAKISVISKDNGCATKLYPTHQRRCCRTRETDEARSAQSHTTHSSWRWSHSICSGVTNAKCQMINLVYSSSGSRIRMHARYPCAEEDKNIKKIIFAQQTTPGSGSGAQCNSMYER